MNKGENVEVRLLMYAIKQEILLMKTIALVYHFAPGPKLKSAEDYIDEMYAVLVDEGLAKRTQNLPEDSTIDKEFGEIIKKRFQRGRYK